MRSRKPHRTHERGQRLHAGSRNHWTGRRSGGRSSCGRLDWCERRCRRCEELYVIDRIRAGQNQRPDRSADGELLQSTRMVVLVEVLELCGDEARWHSRGIGWAMKLENRCLIVLLLGSLFIGTSARAQDLYIYPSKGQSQAQQDKDRYECHSWAVKETMGGMVGGMRRRDERRQQANSQTADASAAASSQRTSYNRAMAACLQGRGYNVN